MMMMWGRQGRVGGYVGACGVGRVCLHVIKLIKIYMRVCVAEESLNQCYACVKTELVYIRF